MIDIFTQLGFSAKEKEAYKLLLQEPALTAAAIAKRIGESRTNTYMVLSRLEQEGMVEIDESQPVRRYRPLAPRTALQKKAQAKQEELRQLQQGLQQTIGEMQALYNLSQLKPGVVYLEGLEGLKTMLEDIEHSNEEVLLIPYHDSSRNEEAWKVLQAGVSKRAKRGVVTRAIFHESSRKLLEVDRLHKQNYEVRFWGGRDYPGELVVYGDKSVFTSYEPTVINTILTNKVIAQTLRNLFEEIWEKAKP